MFPCFHRPFLSMLSGRWTFYLRRHYLWLTCRGPTGFPCRLSFAKSHPHNLTPGSTNFLKTTGGKRGSLCISFPKGCPYKGGLCRRVELVYEGEDQRSSWGRKFQFCPLTGKQYLYFHVFTRFGLNTHDYFDVDHYLTLLCLLISLLYKCS